MMIKKSAKMTKMRKKDQGSLTLKKQKQIVLFNVLLFSQHCRYVF